MGKSVRESLHSSIAEKLQQIGAWPLYLVLELRGGLIEEIILEHDKDRALERARNWARNTDEPLDLDDDDDIIVYESLSESFPGGVVFFESIYSCWDDLEDDNE